MPDSSDQVGCVLEVLGWGLGFKHRGLLGGSWVVISGVVSPLVWVISIVTLHITLLITTHEPPSRCLGL